jgi:1,5-rhamnosyltransferase
MNKFVIFGSLADYGAIRYSDILKEPNIQYIFPENKYRFNKDYSIRFDQRFISEYDNSFFIFEEGSYLYDKGFIDYLHTRYKRAKLIFIFSNPINLNKAVRDEQLLELKNMFDLIITSNKYDVDKYNLTYFPAYYSKVDNLVLNSEKNIFDIFFVGVNKSRINKINEIYNHLTENDVKCDFYVTEVEEKDQLFKDGIKYNQKLNYEEVLIKLNQSKCILEVLQYGQKCSSLRTLEALVYNKKLLTNNKLIENEEYYNKEQIQIIDNCQNIDIEFIKNDRSDLSSSYENQFSPKKLLEYILNYQFNSKYDSTKKG